MSRDFDHSEADRYEVGMDHFQRPRRVSSRHSDDKLVDGMQVRSKHGGVLVPDYEHFSGTGFVGA
ncbi:hypothetical protein ACLQ28_33480 [Micromonospora sp. DT201]|uniref:hypothetical protein n=1 Tax=Micromonospora sp. DT201 TaxID=3393442 RepID=UPI003CF3BDF9